MMLMRPLLLAALSCTMLTNVALGQTAFQFPSASGITAAQLDTAGKTKADINSCAVRPSGTYTGAMYGASDLAVPGNVANLQATHDVSFYLASYGMTQVAGLNVGAIQSNWGSQATGIIEVGTDPVNMPDIAANYASYINLTDEHWTWGTTKGTTWPALIAAGGWKPAVAVLNTFGMGTTNSLTDPYYLMNVAAIADVKAAAPSIKYVLPYVSPNGAPVNTALGDTDFTSTYWGESRALALLGGGLGIDTPANYFLYAREPAYRTLVAQEITWSKANGLVSEVLLSPYALGAAAGTTPQFQYDPSFLEAVQAEVAYLHAAGADPTFYVVANYSEGGGINTPGSDTGTETINAAALWVARNAPTSAIPSTFPAGFQAEANTPCALALTAGRASKHVLASDVDGLGGMAWQNPTNVNLTGGRINNLAALSTTSGSPITLGNDGGAQLQILYDGVGNLGINSLNGNVTPNLNANVNFNLPGSQSFRLHSSGAYPFGMYSTGTGNTAMGDGFANGNLNLSDNLHLTGAQSLSLNSTAAYPFNMTSTGTGNTSMSDGLANGNLNLTDNLHITDMQTLSFNSNSGYPFNINSTGTGNTSMGDGLALGNLNLSDNLRIVASQSISLNSSGPQPFTMSSNGKGDTYFTDALVGGNLHLTDNLLTTGTVQSPDFHESAFVVPASSTATCVTGSFGDGVLSGVAYHFYCYGTNQWSRSALSTTAWP